MPVGAYYGGHGRTVMRAMRERYGEERGERIFYATAKTRDQEPEDATKKKKRRHTILKGEG